MSQIILRLIRKLGRYEIDGTRQMGEAVPVWTHTRHLEYRVIPYVHIHVLRIFLSAV
jgi:hypothetical protein